MVEAVDAATVAAPTEEEIFALQEVVRSAFETARTDPSPEADAAAKCAFAGAEQHQLLSFSVSGSPLPYHRTPEQLQTESAVRQTIAHLLRNGVPPSQIREESLRNAFSGRTEMVRAAIESTSRAADEVVRLDRMGLPPTAAQMELLEAAVPRLKNVGKYADLRSSSTMLQKGERRGFEAHHIVQDLWLRPGGRQSSQALNDGLAIMLFDGQTHGTEHHLVTVAQRDKLREWQTRGRNPTMREVIEASCECLFVALRSQNVAFQHVLRQDSPLMQGASQRTRVREFGEWGSAISGGLMARRRESESIARGVCCVLRQRLLTSAGADLDKVVDVLRTRRYERAP